jgi:hypothetical protein
MIKAVVKYSVSTEFTFLAAEGGGVKKRPVASRAIGRKIQSLAIYR